MRRTVTAAPSGRALLAVAIALAAAPAVAAESPPFLGAEHRALLRETVSGALAKAHVVALARWHRVQATEGYHRAAAFVRDRARDVGLDDVRIDALPADGETRYAHFRSYFGWEAEAGRLVEIGPPRRVLADFEERPVDLADYSQDADVVAELVDVGRGDRDADYEGRDVAGRIVLASGPPAAVHRKAVDERGAAGILSDFPNQRTGWSGDDPDRVRWGHLDPFHTRNRFAFMIGPGEARRLRERLAAGETIRLEAHVRARLVPGQFEIVTGVLPGTDPEAGEIVFTCHLDHQSPGANDNASGAATLLEVARVLARLVGEGRLPRPRRTIRFVWPPEIAGTFAWLVRNPAIARRLVAGIHMDMVGATPATAKSVFFLSRPPDSLGSFVGDVGEAFFDEVVATSRRAAAAGDFTEAIVSPEGTKDDFVAEVQGLDLGSDHQVLDDRTFGVPMLYFHDWPDVTIHTNEDRPENMDATKLERVAYLGAAVGYALARLGPEDATVLAAEIAGRGGRRQAEDARRALALLATADGASLHETYAEARNRIEHGAAREHAAFDAMAAFVGIEPERLRRWHRLVDGRREAGLEAAATLYRERCEAEGIPPRRVDRLRPPPSPAALRIPERTETVPGPLDVYYYDFLADRLGGAVPDVGLPAAVRYELLNFADGRRSIAAIRDAVSAELEPVPLDRAVAYFELLERAEVVRLREP